MDASIYPQCTPVGDPGPCRPNQFFTSNTNWYRPAVLHHKAHMNSERSNIRNHVRWQAFLFLPFCPNLGLSGILQADAFRAPSFYTLWLHATVCWLPWGKHQKKWAPEAWLISLRAHRGRNRKVVSPKRRMSSTKHPHFFPAQVWIDASFPFHSGRPMCFVQRLRLQGIMVSRHFWLLACVMHKDVI
jgi:hypothetical protein